MIRNNFIKSVINNRLHSYTIDWVNRVLKNGGSTPSYNTLVSVDNLIKSLHNYGILFKVKSICVFVPDNFIAATCPIYRTYGSDVWTNYNFIPSDLDINGLKGNASNKYLNTGVNTRNAMSTTSNGMTLYVYETVAQQAFDMGCDGSDSGYYELTTGWADGSTTPDSANVFCDETYGSQQVASYFYPTSNAAGYHSGNRIASNNIDIYFSNSTTTHVAHPSTVSHTGYASTNAKTKPLPSVNITCFCTARNTGATPSYFSSKRFSVAAIHDGFTSNESIMFYTAIQLCRQRIGGGWR